MRSANWVWTLPLGRHDSQHLMLASDVGTSHTHSSTFHLLRNDGARSRAKFVLFRISEWPKTRSQYIWLHWNRRMKMTRYQEWTLKFELHRRTQEKWKTNLNVPYRFAWITLFFTLAFLDLTQKLNQKRIPINTSNAIRFQGAGAGVLKRGSWSVCLWSSRFSSASRRRREAERFGGKIVGDGEREREREFVRECAVGDVGRRSYFADIVQGC